MESVLCLSCQISLVVPDLFGKAKIWLGHIGLKNQTYHQRRLLATILHREVFFFDNITQRSWSAGKVKKENRLLVQFEKTHKNQDARRGCLGVWAGGESTVDRLCRHAGLLPVPHSSDPDARLETVTVPKESLYTVTKCIKITVCLLPALR